MKRRLFRVHGLVQGVGFRPYIWRLANELGLHGWVRNDGAGVSFAVNGENVSELIARLAKEAPRLARIDRIEEETHSESPLAKPDHCPLPIDSKGFFILESVASKVSTAIGPDAALCADCIRDLCDPANRRWRYAFTTCTHCGPRFTVSQRIPYDRAQTSLSSFPLCAPCLAEYSAPVDRRFHAETTCCPDCGPQLQLLDASGQPLAGDPISATLQLLRAGKIVALKGLGGFHLACLARNAESVAELRERKQREAKPLAIMGLNSASLKDYAQIGDDEQALLDSPAAPIVLCAKTQNELKGIAPGLAALGVMLPTTPLHLLLWHEAAGRPTGTDWLAEKNELLLVMTSANPQGEPLVTDNTEALQRLAGIADAFLMHDRNIVVRCDDSVVRPNSGSKSNLSQLASPSEQPPALPDFQFIRRARGYVPLPIPLAQGGPNVLALGGHLKNSICLYKGHEAFLSQHIGGLDNAAAIAFLEETVTHLLDILDVKPELIAHDLHPDYASTHLALRLSAAWGIPALAIAHHHAHIAALCAEHQFDEAVLGLALDGVGLGTDGAAWGGELLRIEGTECTRLGHLHPLALPGGDRAAREPWRMAVSALHQAGLGYRVGGWLHQYYPGRDAGPLLILLERKLRCPPSSSLGRWFDAVAGLLGLRDLIQFEGQAAMELEGLAAQYGPAEAVPGGYALNDHDRIIDFSPLLLTLLTCKDDAARGAALFHATVAAGLAKWVLSAVDREKVSKIVIGGGCAMNVILVDALRRHLSAAGVTLYEARLAPPNDGGLALGQAWVARQMFKEMKNVSGHSGASR